MTNQQLRFILGALVCLLSDALVDGEDIDGEGVLLTMEAAGLTTVHPTDGIVLSAFATRCAEEFQTAVTGFPR